MKEEILEKAVPLFLKHGIREMSNQNLVEELGISTKTLYKYFKNKEDLLDEVLNVFHERHRRETWNVLSASQNSAALFFDIWHTAIEIQYKVNKAFFEELHYYYPELLKKKEAALEKVYLKQFTKVIYDGINEGVFQKNINPEIVFRGVSILFNAIVRQHQFKSFRVSAYEIFSNTIAHYIRGICTEKGIQELDNHIQNLRATSEDKLLRRKTVSDLR
jgi:AcrR family transcriptional regulator